MRVLEKTIENGVVNWWKKQIINGRRTLPARKMNGMGFRGWPDRLFPIPGGRPLFIEFKRPGEKLTELQEKMINDLLNDGYDVEVHDDKAAAIAAIRQRLDAAPVPVRSGEIPARARRRRALP